jgi:hypothetical protein
MRQRVIALVVVLGVAVALVGVAIGTGGSGSRQHLQKLPTGASAGAGYTTAAAADGRAVARSAMAPAFATEYTVAGPLPDLGSTAPAYGFKDEVSQTAVTELAGALGLDGPVTHDGDAFVASGGPGVLQVGGRQLGAWTFMPGCTVADGGVQCTASGSSGGGVAVACAAPACPAGQPCPPPAPCDAPAPAPARPAGVPSKDESIAAARALLARAGIDTAGADPTADDGWSQWIVTVQAAIDGRTVQGMATSTGVGLGGRIDFASGFLGRPVRLGDYPLAGTAIGLERLKSGRWLSVGGGPLKGVPMAALAGGASTGTASATAAATEPAPPASPPSGAVAPTKGVAAPDQPPVPAPAPTPVEPQPMPAPPARTVTVTGVHLALALVAGPDGTADIVPAYAFETSTGDVLPLVPAVTDELLQDTPATVSPGAKPAPLPMPEPAPNPMPAVRPATP